MATENTDYITDLLENELSRTNGYLQTTEEDIDRLTKRLQREIDGKALLTATRDQLVTEIARRKGETNV